MIAALRNLCVKTLLAFSAIFTFVATPASAAQWKVDFSGRYWAYDNADGYEIVEYSAILTTDDVTSWDWSYEGYRIRGISGTRNGIAITALDTESRSDFGGPLGWPSYPFLRLDPFSYFGDWGFSFQTADGNWYNLNSFGDFDGNYGSERQLDPANPDGLFIVQVGTINVSPFVTAGVPEPATWVMMILGFGMVGGTLRRRMAAPRAATAVA